MNADPHAHRWCLFRVELKVELLQLMSNRQGSLNRVARIHGLSLADRCSKHRQQTIAGELVDDPAQRDTDRQGLL